MQFAGASSRWHLAFAPAAFLEAREAMHAKGDVNWVRRREHARFRVSLLSADHVLAAGTVARLVLPPFSYRAWIWREIFELIRLSFPFFSSICGRVALDRYIGLGFCIVSVELEPLSRPRPRCQA